MTILTMSLVDIESAFSYVGRPATRLERSFSIVDRPVTNIDRPVTRLVRPASPEESECEGEYFYSSLCVSIVRSLHLFAV